MIRRASLALFVAGFRCRRLAGAQPLAPACPRLPRRHRRCRPTYSCLCCRRVAASAHAATLAESPLTAIAAAWFAGSREGGRCRHLVPPRLTVRLVNPARSPPANRPPAPFARVRKTGKPVAVQRRPAAAPVVRQRRRGGWAAARSTTRVRNDGGNTWSWPTKPQTRPCQHHQHAGAHAARCCWPTAASACRCITSSSPNTGEWLRRVTDGRIIDKARMVHPVRTLQPAVVAQDSQRALALLRDAGPFPVMAVATTADGGQHWQAGEALPPKRNPNSIGSADPPRQRPPAARRQPENSQRGDAALYPPTTARPGSSAALVETAPDGGAEFSTRHCSAATAYPPAYPGGDRASSTPHSAKPG